jgi:tripartite-type tricarboxylate transporter receptor subunit TctC
VISNAVETEGFKQRFGPMAFQTNIKTGAELQSFMSDEAAKWKQVMTESNVRFTD